MSLSSLPAPKGYTPSTASGGEKKPSVTTLLPGAKKTPPSVAKTTKTLSGAASPPKPASAATAPAPRIATPEREPLSPKREPMSRKGSIVEKSETSTRSRSPSPKPPTRKGSVGEVPMSPSRSRTPSPKPQSRSSTPTRSRSGSMDETKFAALQTRREVKAYFKEKVKRITEAIDLIPVFADKLASLGHRDMVELDGEYYGRKNFDEFLRLLAKEVRLLYAVAFKKIHRNSSSGFSALVRFKPNLAQFFAEANLGPYVESKVADPFDESGKKVKKEVDLVEKEETLNDMLYFCREKIGNKTNPLYAFAYTGIINALFSLHAYYSGMQKNGRLSASDEMRKYLAEEMEQAIRRDYEKAKEMEGVSRKDLDTLRDKLLKAINDPDVVIQNSKIGDMELFNPNSFTHAHFSKLINACKEKVIDAEESEELNTKVRSVYKDIVDLGEDPVQSVLDHQQQMVRLAKEYKNRQIETKK